MFSSVQSLLWLIATSSLSLHNSTRKKKPCCGSHAPMEGDDSSNEDSLSVPADATTPPENHDDDAFAAELQDLELRLEQLELDQRSLRIQLQRARLRHAGYPTTPSTPPTTSEPSARPSPTPERSTSSEHFDGQCNNPYLRPPTVVSSRTTTTRPPEHHTSHPTFAR